jgi:hypothetical protein
MFRFILFTLDEVENHPGTVSRITCMRYHPYDEKKMEVSFWIAGTKKNTASRGCIWCSGFFLVKLFVHLLAYAFFCVFTPLNA